MDLTDYEKQMLDGRFGEGVAEAMKIQVALGEAFDAERMVEISRAHVSFGNFESDIWFVEQLLKGGARCQVSPTNNPLYDSEYLESIGQPDPEEDAMMLMRADKAFREIGVTLTYSCTPELEGNVPRSRWPPIRIAAPSSSIGRRPPWSGTISSSGCR